MAFVICPSCGEKGRLPRHLIGHRIKCQKCGTSFLVEAPHKAAPVETAVGKETVQVRVFDKIPDRNQIAVDGLDEAEWKATAVVTVDDMHEPAHAPAHDHEPHRDALPAFTAHHETPEPVTAVGRHYKILTQKDKWFEGKFDSTRLEECLNEHARKGWTVKAMTSALMPGFGGTMKDELLVLLER